MLLLVIHAVGKPAERGHVHSHFSVHCFIIDCQFPGIFFFLLLRERERETKKEEKREPTISTTLFFVSPDRQVKEKQRSEQKEEEEEERGVVEGEKVKRPLSAKRAH